MSFVSPELIRRNMQEVLDSVKKIHKQRHKQKKKKKCESNAAGPPINSNIPNNLKSPLKEITKNKSKSAEDTKTPTKLSNTLLSHFSVSRKSAEGDCSVNEEKPATARKSNAFEIMMSARNKSIGGGGTPGKTASPSAEEESTETEEKTQNVKRKLMLQEWNEKKGARKRKLEEEGRDDYITEQMDKRAKRLKKMLTSDNTTISSADTSEKNTSRRRPSQRKRVKRLASVDSEIDEPKTPTEDKEFHSKLNSPIKKRDSLLGYFPKVQSPNEVQSTPETPDIKIHRKRGRPKKAAFDTPIPADEDPVSLDDAADDCVDVEIESRRPRRSCTLQSKLETEELISPQPQRNRKSKSDSIIEIEEDDEEYTPHKSTPNTKIAPMFMKPVPKPVVDPEIVKARQEFLMSGVPDKMRRDIDKQKKFDEKYEILLDLFPKVSHVTQNAAITTPVDLRKILKFIDEKDEEIYLPKKPCKITDCKKQDFKRKPMLPEPLILLEEINNKRDIIKNWKMHYDRFPTFKCYNQMREKYRFHSAIDSTLDTQEISESFVVTRKNLQKQHAELTSEDEKPPPSAPNGELLFTDKYKPLLIEQVLVNLTPVNLLKEFLSSWSTPGNNGASGSGYTSEESNSSQFNSNSVVLLGPKSSGKSNAVFSLANEMNFNVLEINAGMKRSGKKLLSDLHEATQSHQIRKKQKDGLSAKTVLKKNLSTQNSDIMKMSLILIEDADIIFDNHDAGFVDAIYTLASTSKRPLIIVAEDLNCLHLQRLIKQNSIVFNPPNPLSITKFLSVLALLENCPIEINQLLSLYLYNKKDLRRTINEMQFFIQSGGDKKRIESYSYKYFAVPPKKKSELLTNGTAADDGLYMHKRFFEFYTGCQNHLSNSVPYPVNFNGLWMNMGEMLQKALPISPVARKKRRSKCPPSKQKENNFSSFSEFYDNISVAESIAFLESNNENRAYSSNLGDEIAHYLVEASIKTNINVPECPYNLYDDTQRECTSVMKSLQSFVNVKASAQISVDYEPYIRAICRSELNRQEGERKGSRFYHHLRFMSQNFTSVSNEFQKKVCNVFIDNEGGDDPVLSQESQNH